MSEGTLTFRLGGRGSSLQVRSVLVREQDSHMLSVGPWHARVSVSDPVLDTGLVTRDPLQMVLDRVWKDSLENALGVAPLSPLPSLR